MNAQILPRTSLVGDLDLNRFASTASLVPDLDLKRVSLFSSVYVHDQTAEAFATKGQLVTIFQLSYRLFQHLLITSANIRCEGST